MKFKLIIILFFLPTLIGCGKVYLIKPTPLPGWSADVRELFVQEGAFPEGWFAFLDRETNALSEANHVNRTYTNGISSGGVSQNIWRSYTIKDAEDYYEEQKNSLFGSRLPEEELILPWLPPDEIIFPADFAADEYFILCGWEEWAYCKFLARYHNYTTYLQLDREAVFGEHSSEGLTFQEMNKILLAVDQQFEQTLNTYTP